ncbi:MAG: site-specific DNA-methyltransferase [Candidatus Magnetobacterium sp. LHC-1]|nr:site-specific DNA-methyltransferase [Nitrospirota bacterium]
MTDNINGASLDIAADNRERLRQLFPSVFTETVNDEGIVTESIDFERLKAELGTFTDIFEDRREHYGMDWPGKKDALRVIQHPSHATLKPCREESINFDGTENLFIEGDNLEVLKLLQKSYYDKVKVIYIDPPYNTGKEFIYPDNYSESLETYLQYAGLTDGNGRKFSTNTANEGRFHTKWLNMMYPRLYLARNLLRDDGVIFISIDDNEVCNLRKVCDEIFGEDNFVAEVIWKKRSTPPNDKIIGAQHEYILVFCKNTESIVINLKRRRDEQIARYKNPDNHPKGPWTPGDLMANVKGGRYVDSLFYPIINPRTGQEHFPSSNGNWRFNSDKVNELIKSKEIYFGEDDHGRPKLKRFLCDVKEGITWSTLWDFVPLNTAGSQEMADIFGNLSTFENPKPRGLLTEIIKIGSLNSDIILDFFAGSCTTAHAVLDLNKQDGGNRKFICVQLPEPCAPDSEAFKAGYKTIADIGKERIRRVIKRLNEEKEGSLDFSAASAQDRGFKVLKLDKSNFRQWQKLDAKSTPEQIEKQLFDHIDHIDHGATQEDLLYEILLKAGYQPTEKVVTLTIADKLVFSIDNGALLICLEKEVTKELTDTVIDTNLRRFICLDSAFGGNDQLKVNTAQTFAAHNMQQEKQNQIVFTTV